jgi:hypothetical protein
MSERELCNAEQTGGAQLSMPKRDLRNAVGPRSVLHLTQHVACCCRLPEDVIWRAQVHKRPRVEAHYAGRILPIQFSTAMAAADH